MSYNVHSVEMGDKNFFMDIYTALRNRRSVRKFSQEDIEYTDIIKMIDCARMSPCAANMQSLKYMIINNDEKRNEIFPFIKYAGYIPDWNPQLNESPTAFIAVLNDTKIRPTNALSECDCGIAMMSISLVAFEMGIGSCILGSIDKNKIKEILKISTDYDIMYLIGLGYPKQSNFSCETKNDIKYVMDDEENFRVSKRKLEDILI